jgi:hypothetical protein
MIFKESFYQIHQGEIFKQSNYLAQEHAIANLFTNFLTNLGYKKTSNNNRTWQRDNKKVIVCLADDFGICRSDFVMPPPRWFDQHTTVITDNHMPMTTLYQMHQLPVSYFGIFNYVPANQNYVPVRRFNFSVNRLDDYRMLILLELIQQSDGLHQVTGQDYINFNAREFDTESTLQDIKNNFQYRWNQLTQLRNYLQNSNYNDCFEQALQQVPIKNHNLSIEQTMVSAYINVVIETYAGDASIAFSEKIFRALVTPAPWIVFSARHAVKYLKTLGFDTLDDIIDHSYDELTHDQDRAQEKIFKFVKLNLQNYQALKLSDSTKLADRCQQAAQHNQQLLTQMQHNWPKDFALWLPSAIEKIQ